MPHDPSRASPVKPLGENSGNPRMIPSSHPQTSQYLQGRNSNGVRPESLGKTSNDQIKEGEEESTDLYGKRSRSSKYLKSLLEKPKPKKDAEEGGKGRGHRRTKSTTSYSVFPQPSFSHSGQDFRRSEETDKENQHTPIWAQFATTAPTETTNTTQVPLNDRFNIENEVSRYTPQNYSPSKQTMYPPNEQPTLSRKLQPKPRPKSECLTGAGAQGSLLETLSTFRQSRQSRQSHDYTRNEYRTSRKSLSDSREGQRKSSQGNKVTAPEVTVSKRGTRVMAAVAVFNGKSKPQRPEAVTQPEPETLDPITIESAFESMLDARNVPQNTKDKMRSLDTNIKADLIKQNKTSSGSASSTEGLAKRSSRPGAGKRSKTQDDVSEASDDRPTSSYNDDPSKKPRPRGRKFTFTKDKEGSPTKRQKSERSSSHQRSRSGELRASASSKSLVSSQSSSKGWLFAKAQVFTTPDECISYLRKREELQAVEVGKVHKLRQLLRNETVEWVNTFITDGGMTEIIDLLYRILVVEWREEHEDTLLHETLTCLKALSTTSLALQKLTAIHGSIFPALLALLFSEEKKGPSEFTTRSLIIGLLSTYISSAPTPDITTRARAILSYLHDPSKPEASQLPGFIASMHQPRPYRVWQKEISDVTKEVFWIFLHHGNAIPYPPSPSASAITYSARHYPKPHPPVPAAPYVGGVEWDATTYLTAHLDLLNAILASLPTTEERNTLRQELKDSGFEKVMGASLRTCKEKFYGSVHEALICWVGAASEDGWDVKGVREGALPKTAQSSPRKDASPRKRDMEKAPILDMPKLELGECVGRHKGKEEFDGWF